jgi:hypothetical protein
VKPIGYFRKDKTLVVVLPKEGEEAQATNEAAAKAHGVELSTVAQTPEGYEDVLLVNLPAPAPPPAKIPSPGDSIPLASKGVTDFYRSPRQPDRAPSQKEKKKEEGDQTYAGLIGK